MKKTIYLTIIIALLMTSFGCSYLKEKKVPEKEEIKEVENSEPSNEVTDFWPANEFTNQVPKFTYGINERIYTNNETGFIYGADDVTADEYKQYKKDLKKAGFKDDVSEIIDTITTYTASKDIYEVSLSYVDNTLTITIIKESLQQ
jgi:hypothetical protein